MKNYIKPEVKINSFVSEDITTASGTGTPSTPHTLASKGRTVATISNLFEN